MSDVRVSLYPLRIESPRGRAFIAQRLEADRVDLCVEVGSGLSRYRMMRTVPVGSLDHARFVGAITDAA